MKKLLIAAAALALSSSAFAGEYECKVYCTAKSGKMESTYITVRAGSRDEAAKIADNNDNDKVCRAAGYAKATSSTLSASQCSSK